MERQPVAVIDIGSTSARLVIAQSTGDGHIETLDFLQQAIGIGRDTFTTGIIKNQQSKSASRS
jgi:exopolyphosphatase/pppGpp-phosphohydrolase